MVSILQMRKLRQSEASEHRSQDRKLKPPDSHTLAHCALLAVAPGTRASQPEKAST